MLHRLRPKLTYANVVASLALFVALGGSAYAIGTGTIGSREIRDNSVRSRDVRNNTLTGRDVDERTLRVAPNVYLRKGGRTITLGSTDNALTVGCRGGDAPIAGSSSVSGDQLSVRVAGTLTGTGTPTGYAGVVYGEPAAAGQQRFLGVSTVCLTRARR